MTAGAGGTAVQTERVSMLVRQWNRQWNATGVAAGQHWGGVGGRVCKQNGVGNRPKYLSARRKGR